MNSDEFYSNLLNIIKTSPAILVHLRIEEGKLKLNWISPNIETILGYTVEEALLPGWWEKNLHPEDSPRILALRSALLSQGFSDNEFRFLRKDGSIIWLRFISHLICDESGKPVEIVGSLSDISQRKKAEEELKDLLIHFQTLMENLSVGILFEDSQRRIRYVNPALTALFGLSDQPISWIGKDGRETDRLISSFFSDSQKFIDRIENLVASRQPMKGEELQLNDGRVLESDYVPLFRNGDFLGHLWLYRDISDRKRAEDKIKHQLQILSSLYEGTQKLAHSLEPETVAEEVVRACVEIFKLKLAWLGKAEDDGRISLVAQFPDNINYPKEITVRWDNTPEGQGPTGRAVRSGLPQITADFAADHRLTPWRQLALKAGFRSSAAFPLISRGKTFGALNLYSDQPGFFSPERLDLLQAFAHMAAAALENARLYKEAQFRLDRLQALREIDIAIIGSFDPRVALSILLDQVKEKLGVDAASVLLLNPNTQILEFGAARGFRSRAIERSRLRLGEGHAGRAALERRTIKILNLKEEKEKFVRTELLREEEFTSYVVVPMVAKGRLLGVLEIFNRSPLMSDSEWIEFLEALAAQAAIAVDSSQLFYNLERANAELIQAYDSTIEGWSRALDLRDRETEGHSQRVTEITLRIAREMDLPENELVLIRRGALLHDIGKMGIPDSILLKPGALNEEEWKIMRLHPQYAFDMLSSIAYLRPALDIPLYHHEKWDGSGYPYGLKGEQIPLPARIFAVADVYDALTSERPYRKAWSREDALNYIKEQAGKHFDPQVVRVFLQLMEEMEFNF
ncbi:MAG: GAF domain-containing protein [Candidatus Aminicenantes bacterium]|nr:GAF domain-containing protein [Candidatus Aminicenantes bacterium]